MYKSFKRLEGNDSQKATQCMYISPFTGKSTNTELQLSGLAQFHDSMTMRNVTDGTGTIQFEYQDVSWIKGTARPKDCSQEIQSVVCLETCGHVYPIDLSINLHAMISCMLSENHGSSIWLTRLVHCSTHDGLEERSPSLARGKVLPELPFQE